jgi:alkanesulfonate monooxygenase SsuD/methylene tetrahydromethanopterin reductase-like flavin-dependent oxidoreductase (luciferase family)
MTGCVIGETHADAEERARALYGRRPREVSFDEWLAVFTERAVFGSVDEVAARLLEYEQAGCDRVMLQHLLHTDLDSVRLISSL